MQIIVTKNFEETVEQIAQEFLSLIAAKPDCRLGLATGSTASPIYAKLVEAYQAGRADFSKVRTVNLDEYVGMEPTHPESYRGCMNRWLFDHVNIDKANTVVARGTGDPDEAVEEFNAAIDAGGPVDLQLLGIGVDGHIGFNEPGEVLYAHAHREVLDPSTIQANSRFFENADQVPKEAITMGMGSILKARRIVFAATGANKAAAVKQLVMTDEITTRNPATLLKTHPDCTVYIDQALADQIGYKEA